MLPIIKRRCWKRSCKQSNQQSQTQKFIHFFRILCLIFLKGQHVIEEASTELAERSLSHICHQVTFEKLLGESWSEIPTSLKWMMLPRVCIFPFINISFHVTIKYSSQQKIAFFCKIDFIPAEPCIFDVVLLTSGHRYQRLQNIKDRFSGQV